MTRTWGFFIPCAAPGEPIPPVVPGAGFLYLDQSVTPTFLRATQNLGPTVSLQSQPPPTRPHKAGGTWMGGTGQGVGRGQRGVGPRDRGQL